MALQIFGGSGSGGGASVATLSTTFAAVFTPEKYGAVGNGIADDTAAIQAAITAAARRSDGQVQFSKAYKITDEIAVPAAVVLQGTGQGRYVKITQATNTKSGFRVLRDTGGGEVFNRGPIIRNLMIVGPGAANSVGKAGIYAADDVDTATYQGQRLDLDVIVTGFETGVKTVRWDNSKITLQVEACTTGLNMSGNANSNVIDLSASTLTGTAFIHGDGGGNHVTFRDVRNCAQVMEIQSAGAAVVDAGNFEEINGADAYFHIKANGKLFLLGGSYTKGTIGTEIPVVRVDTGGSGGGFGTLRRAGFAATTATIVVAATASFPWLGGQEGAGALGSVTMSNGADGIYNAVDAMVRQDGSIPTAAAAVRGSMLYEMARDASNRADALHFFVRDRSSGSDAWSRRTLSSIVTGNGTPEAVVAARVGTLYLNENVGTGSAPMYVKRLGTTNTGWQPLTEVNAFASGFFTNAAQTPNVANKFQGKQAFDTTLNKPLWATGSTATSTWVDATGTVVYTPA